jgi:hypothetical protein
VIPLRKKVEFENVSFQYDPCAFGNVKAEKVPDHRLENPDDKPDEVAPEHMRFEFENGPKGWEPFVEVYSVQRFPEMYAANKQSMRGMKQEISNLKSVIKMSGLRFHKEIPYLPYIDASQDFQAHVKTSPFSGGNGIYFLTYISTEISLVCNDHLRYIFEGLTSDGKYYILAELPVAVPFLPKDGGGVENYNFKGFTDADLWEMARSNPYGQHKNPAKYAELSKRYDVYLTGVTKRLDGTRTDEFTPSLNKLDELVASLRINN